MLSDTVQSCSILLWAAAEGDPGEGAWRDPSLVELPAASTVAPGKATLFSLFFFFCESKIFFQIFFRLAKTGTSVGLLQKPSRLTGTLEKQGIPVITTSGLMDRGHTRTQQAFPVGHTRVMGEDRAHPSRAGYPGLTVSTPLLWGLLGCQSPGTHWSWGDFCALLPRSPPLSTSLHSQDVWNCPLGVLWKFLGALLTIKITIGRGHYIQLASRTKNVGCCAIHKHSQTTKNHPSVHIHHDFQMSHCTFMHMDIIVCFSLEPSSIVHINRRYFCILHDFIMLWNFQLIEERSSLVLFEAYQELSLFLKIRAWQ